MEAMDAASAKMRDRFSLSAEEYLSMHGVDVFLRDVVNQILDARVDQPLMMVSKYFSRVSSLNHVSGREFEFVDACPRNRLAFMRLFQRTFHGNIDAGETLLVQDYHQLVQMLCPDFPVSIIRTAVSTFPGSKYPFIKLSRALQLYLFYRTFLKQVGTLFKDASTLADHIDDGGSSRASSAKVDGLAPTLDVSGAEVVLFDCNVVSATLARIFYSTASNPSDVTCSTTEAASERVAANSKHFEAAAAKHVTAFDKCTMCVPPLWGVVRALSIATDHATRGCSWTSFFRAFLSQEELLEQLCDEKLKPPLCAIASNAVACSHEARCYELMDALVINDITAQAKNKKLLDARPTLDKGVANDGKKRRKKGQRRR